MPRPVQLFVTMMFAGVMAGCLPMRRPAPATALPEPAPVERTAIGTPPFLSVAQSKTAAPDYAPALYIPGPADAPAPIVSARLLPPSAAPSPDGATTLPPLVPSEPSASDNPLRALERKAAANWATIDSYACRIRRREVVGGQPKPEELILAKFRKEPFSVSMQWIGPEAKGREVVYVHGQHGNLIHTLTASGDIFLVPGGTRFKVAPDSVLVKNKSRYPITEAGIGALIERFAQLVEAQERGDPRASAIKYLGQIKRKEFESHVEAALQTILPGWEAQLPKGGQRLWFFDAEHGLPVLIVTQDEAGHEVEYYCHDRFEFPSRFGDGEFDPDQRWQKTPVKGDG
jgi:hypothetical protein